MRLFTSLTCFFCLGLFGVCSIEEEPDWTTSPAVMDSIQADGWELVWSDEFEEATIDLTKWSFQNGNGCPDLCGWGNNELEYYTDRPQNASTKDGRLLIRARKEEYEGYQFTSSKLISKGKGDFRFGRIEVRAKLPEGQGIWPAIWMLPTDEVHGGWAASGEIDILEVVGHEPNTIHGTVHYNAWPDNRQLSQSYEVSADLSESFHTYAIEWEQDTVRWWFDEVNYFTVKKGDLPEAEQYPFNEKFYLILNLAVGGNWPGSPNSTTQFPQQLEIEYVRVYQRK